GWEKAFSCGSLGDPGLPLHMFARRPPAPGVIVPGRVGGAWRRSGDSWHTVKVAPGPCLVPRVARLGTTMSSIAKRLATLILTLVVATSLLFVLVHMSGDPTNGFLAPGSSDDVREATRQRLGLDQPLARQYLMFLG